MRVLRCPFCDHEAESTGKLWGHYGRCAAVKDSGMSRADRRELMSVAVNEWHEAPEPEPIPETPPEMLAQCPYCEYQGLPAQVFGHSARCHPGRPVQGKAQSPARVVRSVNVRFRHAPKRSHIERLYDAYRDGARERNYTWKLTVEQFSLIIIRPCVYCGAEPKASSSHRFPHTGIDRVDNSRGYELDNCAPCCGHCNQMKGKLASDDFIEQCRRIVAHADRKAPRVKDATELPTGFRAIKFEKDTKQY